MDNDFKEVSENYTIAEAIREARRCLGCKVPGCKKGCPVSNDIPEWIAELAKGNFGNAMSIIHSRSNLPAVCGRVCAHERQCEGHCVLGKKGTHINIGKLERFVADFDSEAGLAHEAIPEKSRGRVAVIGSGPAGLTIAGDLSRQGFAVEIFEMEPEPGGVLMFGIPEYRLPKEVVRREIKKIENLGVTFHLNTTIGRDFTVDDLFAKGFDAIFIGTGTGKPKKLDIPGINHRGVRQAIWFLRRVSLFQNGNIDRKEVIVNEGDKVFVIGCGNTAIDAARTAVRMGAAEVTVVYHRTINDMKALRSEYDDAVAEGVKFLWNSSVKDITGAEGTRLSHIIIDTEGTARTVEADRLILAVGSAPAARIVSTTEGIEVDDKGYVLTRDTPYGMTTRPGVFAGGDVTNRPATVVHAMQDAKSVAEGIARYIDAVKLMESIK
ncbi:MAG TPA: NAD(P)-dependent oxidoreductase [Muribaculum sp.]|jgi:glutamate synthase (NADPH/NADH) small chain|uniref:NAD(P)-dependent oxidoreductase n=1 Tax=Heminiphilus faecis TaxID=2601703 RepID=A0ABV4D1I0_9BACT|nr:NAD(P)-dependent oxidoreductase [Heminiphilus faecis]RLT77886.1 NAD(P)-dependent oxidoreductase [bacterium J10(2018)]DAT44809.1 MAG TPA: dihydropyrimidine dehydrogenase subunit A [Caudoviricetes sp.]HRF68033.1 NAD(P)-dependent oxidoreductase [Muribaculum sp.]